MENYSTTMNVHVQDKTIQAEKSHGTLSGPKASSRRELKKEKKKEGNEGTTPYLYFFDTSNRPAAYIIVATADPKNSSNTIKTKYPFFNAL